MSGDKQQDQLRKIAETNQKETMRAIHERGAWLLRELRAYQEVFGPRGLSIPFVVSVERCEWPTWIADVSIPTWGKRFHWRHVRLQGSTEEEAVLSVLLAVRISLDLPMEDNDEVVS
jgi:hypothetical protein